MNTQLIPVPFHQDTLVLVDENNEPLVAMKPIVTGMGLDWKGQHVKLAEKFSSVMEIISTTGGDGKNYEMVCLPLRKLPAWLYSVNPNKVAPDIANKVRQYQEECDDVLWEYWTKGHVSKPGMQRPALTDPFRQHLRAGDKAAALIPKIRTTTDDDVRRVLYNTLVECCRVMGEPVPALEDLRPLVPQEPAEVEAFWQQVDELTKLHGVELNHSRRAGLIAINLQQVVQAAKDHGLPMQSLPVLREHLRKSAVRKYLGSRAVNSAFEEKTVRCWLFAEPEQQA